MRSFYALVFVLSLSGSALASEPLPATALQLPAITVPDKAPENFDLADVRAAAEEVVTPSEVQKHSFFGFKKHFGASIGYDDGVLHGSLGMYLTVAEWGRWNFGVPAPTIGFGRYPSYDSKRGESVVKDEATIIVSMASVHYRLGYVRSLGMNSYLNLEQVFDARHNMRGSQFGLSFSAK